LRNRVPIALVVSRDVRFHVRHHGREHIIIAAVLGKKNLDAGARGLNRFDENEFMFVGNNHSTREGSLRMIGRRCKPERDNELFILTQRCRVSHSRLLSITAVLRNLRNNTASKLKVHDRPLRIKACWWARGRREIQYPLPSLWRCCVGCRNDILCRETRALHRDKPRNCQ
jgi:hypothetical protein